MDKIFCKYCGALMNNKITEDTWSRVSLCTNDLCRTRMNMNFGDWGSKDTSTFTRLDIDAYTALMKVLKKDTEYIGNNY